MRCSSPQAWATRYRFRPAPLTGPADARARNQAPRSMPGERNSWLFVPLLHPAGNLTARAKQPRRCCPRIGLRFDKLVTLLRDARPAMPTGLARTRTLLEVVDCEAHEAARCSPYQHVLPCQYPGIPQPTPPQ